MRKISKNILNNIEESSLFSGNYHSVFLYKKTEKISMAVYLVTEFLRDSDPLKTKLRSTALSLVSQSLDSAFPKEEGKHTYSKQLISTLFSLVSFFEIAFVNSLISRMNYFVLRAEFESLITFIETVVEKDNFLLPLSIRSDFFSVQQIETGSFVQEDGVKKENFSLQTVKNNNKGHSNVLYKNPPRTQVKKDSIEKGDDLTERKNKRLTSILSLLEKSSGRMIKDFSAVIKDCSEKTIQRELLALVSQGVLKKEGERRWSRYSLASLAG